ncbi:MAG TPA: NAD-dependent epimerase/dehydratase family protein [Rhodospirillales bacterium]|nr:NAD-dependent epimerase/dehydratase family protein [Rhodospirillales bacterium]
MTKRKIVLTGGAGFLLSHVAENYAAMNDEVVIFDRIEADKLPSYAKTLLSETGNTAYVEGDIRDRDAVKRVIDGADMVYHFSALMGTSARFGQETATTEVNVIGTINACQAATDAGVDYFIYPPRPMQTGWLTPYIIAKTASTQFVQMYHQVYGLPTVGLNIANAYGPRERAVLEANPMKKGEGRKMMATFIEKAIKNESLPVMGDGQQSSDFVFVGDVVDACMKAPTPAAVGRIIEIGTGINTTVKDVAERIIKMTGSKSEIEFVSLRTGEKKIHTKSDTVDAEKYLGWKWKTTLEEGLKKTIPWYAEQLRLPSPL